MYYIVSIMPKYQCERCFKDFNQKCEYTRHLNKKFKCKNIAPKCTETAPDCTEYKSIIGDENSEIRCHYCGTTFTRGSSLTRHIENRCKIKKANDAKMEELMTMLIEIKESNKEIKENNKKLVEDMKKLKEENANYKQIITNNNTQNIQTQNNVYVKVVAYGKEDVSKLTDNDYKRIFVRGMNSIPALLEKMHFDKNVPENHNVYISNLRDEYVLMYDGKKWRLKDREDALQQLYEDKADILETKFEELIEKLDEPTIKMFKRFLKIKDDDEEKIKVIKKELKKTLYENRRIAMKTRKLEIKSV
jgi:hypothetical protein